MNIIEILKKLGILRVGGTAATYKNAKDRPIEFQDDSFMGQSKSKDNENQKPQN